MRHSAVTNILAYVGPANVVRLAVVIAHIRFDRSMHRLAVERPRVAATIAENAFTASGASAAWTAGNIRPDPMWQQGVDVDPSTGRLYVAVAGYGAASHGRPRGTIRVGHSDDGGATWSFSTLPSLGSVAGRR